MLGLGGLRVVSSTLFMGERWIKIETTPTIEGCRGCGVVAELHARRTTTVRDVSMAGVPVVLAWDKRIWRCRDSDCATKTWTEIHPAICARAVLTERARWDICVQVGRDAHSVAEMARHYGISWDTAWRAVADYGAPLVAMLNIDKPVWALGIDETSFLRANRARSTQWATGIVDLDRRRLIDLVPGREGTDVVAWLNERSDAWRDGVGAVAIDPHTGYRNAISEQLPNATVVLDVFHAIGLANRRIDDVRRRVQNETLGHRGRSGDPLYGIRKLLLCGEERVDARGMARLMAGLAAGDPYDEIGCVWVAKELLRDVYTTGTKRDAHALLVRFYTWCADHSDIPELVSLARSIANWQDALLAFWDEPYTNGPTEALNLLVKKIKRVGCGFRRFENYRLRVLLHAGVAWQNHHQTARLRPHAPRLIA